MSDAYTGATYGASEHGFGAKPAILVVDLQKAFTDPQYPIGNLPLIHEATDNTAKLLKVARAVGVPVAKCYTSYHSRADMPRWKVQAVVDEFFHDHPCAELEPRIDDPDYDYNFCKSGPSIFFQTPLITYLAKHQVDTLIVTGCTTSGCVRASIVDGFSYGFRVVLPEDCSGDAERGPHEDTLRDVGRRYCDIKDRAAVEAYLRSLAGEANIASAG